MFGYINAAICWIGSSYNYSLAQWFAAENEPVPTTALVVATFAGFAAGFVIVVMQLSDSRVKS